MDVWIVFTPVLKVLLYIVGLVVVGTKLFDILFRKYPEIEPSKHIVNEMHKMFKFWDELQEGGLFFANHPNNESTKKFAKFLLPEIERFLNT